MTPVLELYEMPEPFERLVDETLLLKVDQSVLARYPLVVALAWVMEKLPVLELYARGVVAEREEGAR